jgi:hypothetical protein
MPGCMVKRDGKTMHLTPSVKPVQSIFQGMLQAAVLGLCAAMLTLFVRDGQSWTTRWF